MPVTRLHAWVLRLLVCWWVAVCVALMAMDANAHDGRLKYAPDTRRLDSFQRCTAGGPTGTNLAFMRSHFFKAEVWSHYWDGCTDDLPNVGLAYKDAYDGRGLPSNWILKDAQGRTLYIPYGCNGTSCPQPAADIGNPAFRADWIAKARALLGSRPYAGLFVDDVNMPVGSNLRVGYADGRYGVHPVDPRTGATMTDQAWQNYMATFMQEISDAFPNHQIAHNGLWRWTDLPWRNETVARQLGSAHYLMLERGPNDAENPDRFTDLVELARYLHEYGTRVWWLDYNADTDDERWYGLAVYHLLSDGWDLYGQTPSGLSTSWWAPWDWDLGQDLGWAIQRQDGVWERRFTNGKVLVNPPGNGTRVVDGITLAARRGSVQRGNNPPATTTSTTKPPVSTTTATTSTSTTTCLCPCPCRTAQGCDREVNG